MQTFGRKAAVRQTGVVLDQFGPFRISEAVPWLLLASALRAFGHIAGKTIVIEVLLVQCLVFMAFSATAHSIVTESGGRSVIGGFSLAGKIRLMKNVIKKVLWFQFGIILLYLFLAVSLDLNDEGARELSSVVYWAGSFFVAFDGMVYTSGFFVTRIASSIMGVMVFLWVIASATERPVTWQELLKSLGEHWLAMAISVIVLTACMHFINYNQLKFLGFLMADVTTDARLQTIIYIFYQTAFAFFRMWLMIYVLTTALKWSYRNQRAS
ncbi:MAG: hypothetical protein AAGA76_05660 [Pseudomonadota bacterium]